jgi:phospholipase C
VILPAACSQLSDIEHVVILIQEDRSFDHYFGSYRHSLPTEASNTPKLHPGDSHQGVRNWTDARLPRRYDVPDQS